MKIFFTRTTAFLLGAAAALLVTRADDTRDQDDRREKGSGGGGGGGFWISSPNTVRSCDFPSDHVDVKGTITFLGPIVCSTPQVIHVRSGDDAIVRSHAWLIASNVHFVVHQGATLTLWAKKAIEFRRDQNSTKPILSILGEVAFKADGWIDSFGRGSKEDEGVVVQFEEGGRIVPGQEVRYTAHSVIAANELAMYQKIDVKAEHDQVKLSPKNQAALKQAYRKLNPPSNSGGETDAADKSQDPTTTTAATATTTSNNSDKNNKKDSEISPTQPVQPAGSEGIPTLSSSSPRMDTTSTSTGTASTTGIESDSSTTSTSGPATNNVGSNISGGSGNMDSEMSPAQPEPVKRDGAPRVPSSSYPPPRMDTSSFISRSSSSGSGSDTPSTTINIGSDSSSSSGSSQGKPAFAGWWAYPLPPTSTPAVRGDAPPPRNEAPPQSEKSAPGSDKRHHHHHHHHHHHSNNQNNHHNHYDHDHDNDNNNRNDNGYHSGYDNGNEFGWRRGWTTSLKVGEQLRDKIFSVNGQSAMWPGEDGSVMFGRYPTPPTSTPRSEHNANANADDTEAEVEAEAEALAPRKMEFVTKLITSEIKTVWRVLELRDMLEEEDMDSDKNQDMDKDVHFHLRQNTGEKKGAWWGGSCFLPWRRRAERERERARQHMGEVIMTIDDRACLEVTVDGTTVLIRSGKYSREFFNRFPWRWRKDDGYEVHVTRDGIEVQLDGKTVWGVSAADIMGSD